MARGRNVTGGLPPVTTAGRDDAQPPGRGRDDTTPAGRGREGELWKAACFVFAAVAIVAGLAWALLGSSLLVVRSVQVTGERQVSRAEVLQAAGIRLGTPLIRVNTTKVARRVEQLTQVQSAKVSRDWPDKVVISVQERSPALAVAMQGGFGLIDGFGVVVREEARKPPAMPLLTAPVPGAGTSLRGSPAVRAAVAVVRELPAQLRHRVKSVSAPSATAVTLQLTRGITILWGGSDRPAAKVSELSILMRAHASYYDVSDPSVAVTGG
ncbi:MAG: FtsQ-type POTRA domain-containing protein [Streptosporangiaceae bacterium]|jgi:cell division protein FtsQ